MFLSREKSIELMEGFNPNAGKATLEWATFVPSRSNRFKIHKTRGNALNAFIYQDYAILYRFNFQARMWEEIERIMGDARPNECDSCWIPAEELPPGANFKPIWAREPHSKKIADPPKLIHVCSSCARKMKR